MKKLYLDKKCVDLYEYRLVPSTSLEKAGERNATRGLLVTGKWLFVLEGRYVAGLELPQDPKDQYFPTPMLLMFQHGPTLAEGEERLVLNLYAGKSFKDADTRGERTLGWYYEEGDDEFDAPDISEIVLSKGDRRHHICLDPDLLRTCLDACCDEKEVEILLSASSGSTKGGALPRLSIQSERGVAILAGRRTPEER